MATEFIAYTPPTIAGWYRLGEDKIQCIKFSVTKKPNIIHRYFMRILLGWYWEDVKQEINK